MRLDFETILGIIFFVVFFILPAFSRKKKQPEGDAAAPTRPAGEQPASQGSARPVSQDSRSRPATAQQSSTRQVQPQRTTGNQGPQAAPPPSTHRGAPQSRGQNTGGTFEDALDEIRARVREAQLQEDARQSPTGQGQPVRKRRLVDSDPFEERLTTAEASRIRGRESASTAPQGLGREGVPSSGAPVGAGRGGTSTGAGRGGVPVGTGRGGAPSAPVRPTPPQRPAKFGEAPTGLGREGIAEPLAVTRRQHRMGAQASAASARRVDAAQAGEVLPRARSAARISAPVLAMDRKALVTGMIWHEILAEPAAQRRLRRMRSRPR